MTSVGGASLSYDANGNITNDATRAFTYDAANRLTGANGGTSTLSYDALGRLDVYVGTYGGRHIYDGVETVGFAPVGSTALQNRFIRGPGLDEIVANYTTGSTPAQYWAADERGSLVNLSDGTSGANTVINTYDEYGSPAPTNLGRLQYTGQLWMPDFGAYHYKARAYQPELGRFLQTDPIGYQAGANLYAYVGGDPVNFADSLGLMPASRVSCSTFNLPAHGVTPDKIAGGNHYTTCITVGTSASQPNYRERNLGQNAARERGSGSASAARGSCSVPLSSFIGSSRAVLEATAIGADIATVGLAAAGVTAPVAAGAKVFGITVELSLLAVNSYDASVNDNPGPLYAQGASAAARLIPGGRAFQSGAKFVRGPTGLLRNSRGQFRSSYLNNDAIEEAGNIATQRAVGSAVQELVCP